MRLAGREVIDRADAEEALQQKTLLYDQAGEEHYNVVSAFIKSLRGSDPDAAVYWMTRMLEAGEEPRFVLRRMVIFASEDVGNADPQALQLAVAALQAVELVGLPEGVLPMTQAAVYLALAPKSNTAITAYAAARKLVQERGPLPVPLKLRNAPTRLMESMGYGGGYRYPHDFEGHYVAEKYLPDAMRGRADRRALGERRGEGAGRAVAGAREEGRRRGLGGRYSAPSPSEASTSWNRLRVARASRPSRRVRRSRVSPRSTSAVAGHSSRGSGRSDQASRRQPAASPISPAPAWRSPSWQSHSTLATCSTWPIRSASRSVHSQYEPSDGAG